MLDLRTETASTEAKDCQYEDADEKFRDFIYEQLPDEGEESSLSKIFGNYWVT